MVGSAPRKVSQTAPLMKVSGLFRDRADGLTFTPVLPDGVVVVGPASLLEVSVDPSWLLCLLCSGDSGRKETDRPVWNISESDNRVFSNPL